MIEGCNGSDHVIIRNEVKMILCVPRVKCLLEHFHPHSITIKSEIIGNHLCKTLVQELGVPEIASKLALSRH